jgi:hypothetical protein
MPRQDIIGEFEPLNQRGNCMAAIVLQQGENPEQLHGVTLGQGAYFVAMS